MFPIFFCLIKNVLLFYPVFIFYGSSYILTMLLPMWSFKSLSKERDVQNKIPNSWWEPHILLYQKRCIPQALINLDACWGISFESLRLKRPVEILRAIVIQIAMSNMMPYGIKIHYWAQPKLGWDLSALACVFCAWFGVVCHPTRDELYVIYIEFHSLLCTLCALYYYM